VTTPTPKRTPVPQRYRILRLAHLNGPGGFTRRDAALTVGCYELATRIMELEAEGVRFDRKRESDRNSFGDPVRFVRYALAHAPTDVLNRAGVVRR